MAIDSKTPEIFELRQRVELQFGAPLEVHNHFVALSDDIFCKTKEHISETTLERLWNYSTRGYDSVSKRSLDVLCVYIGISGWTAFLTHLKEANGSESDVFNLASIKVSDLTPGDRIKIGWQPNRECIIRYEGACKFVCEESRNSKMKPGDSFSCLQLQLHTPLFLDNFNSSEFPPGSRYGVGLRHGLTILKLISAN